MLLELSIVNVALIERLRLELGPGLNVLTGETGAGKSIVVDSLALAIGGRAERDLIRSGADRAFVEALFDVSDCTEAVSLLREWEMEVEDGLVPVSRELTAAGRSVSRVCGAALPLSKVRQLTSLLIDMHGQHEHQQLLSPARHLAYLDACGDEAHAALMDEARRAVEASRAARREAEKLRLDEAERARTRDMLVYQIQEIDVVKPKPGEEEKLLRREKLLLSAEKIVSGVGHACDLVYRGAGRSMSAQESLKRAAAALESLSGLDEKFDVLKKRLDELYIQAEDVGYELSALSEALEFDPAEADKVSGRLAQLDALERKYGPNLEDVIAFRADAAERLAAIDGGEEKLKSLEKEQNRLESAAKEACARLTKSRKALAAAFSKRLLAQLADLGMEKARFEVSIEALEERTLSGGDKVEFLFSANPGEPLKPLSAVASGGELSRIMLAMKAVFSTGVPSMVFDEVDAGVSGHMAQVVGEKMATLSGGRQVICVTHLPQIAALGDRQYLVEKTVADGRTGSTVRLLTDEGRAEELSRLVGGAGDLASGRAHAVNLLRAARARVQALRGDPGTDGVSI